MKNDVKKALIEKQLKGYKEAIAFSGSIKEVAKKFDGKKITKRFDTALKEVNKDLSFTMEYNSFCVKYYNRDRCISEDNYTEYIQEDVIYLVHSYITSSYKDGICQDGVFIYENFAKAINGRVEHLKKYISDTEEALTNLEALQAEKERIEALREKHNDKVNFIIEHYYNLQIK